jgi:gliotoxin/aspirochlorine biosynthesis gamma-glutamylcyclotransferase
MAHEPQSSETPGDIWYLAYGSNMSRAKFTGGRGIKPKAAARVRVPGWILAFNIPGMPYSEPAFTSIVRRESISGTGFGSENQKNLNEPVKQNRSVATCTRPCLNQNSHLNSANGSYGNEKSAFLQEEMLAENFPDVLGVAYLITADQYTHVIASEGGGIAYSDIELSARPVSEADSELVGGDSVCVRTLGAILHREPWPLPSKRYMDIINTGAVEADLPGYYREFLAKIKTYEAPKRGRGKAGASVFLAVFGPLLGACEKITDATMKSDGHVPFITMWLVRAAVWMIWTVHDFLFAPLIGRGDGLGQAQPISTEVNEKQHLLAFQKDPILYTV